MSKKREAQVTNVLNIRTLRRMLTAYSSDVKDYKRPKGHDIDSALQSIQNRLVNLRQAMRDRSGDRLYAKGKLVKEEVTKIASALNGICARRKFNETITVGKTTSWAHLEKGTSWASYEKGRHGKKPDVKLNVGHMWYRRVWQKLYNDGRYLSDDYIILSAIEYRVNIPHIRLYEAIAYGTAEKTMVNGWVGQSKLGKQYCAFRADKKVAIQIAQKLTVEIIDSQLKEEPNNG